MSQTISTGYVTVSDNQSTNLDLRAYANLISARIRWRGRQQELVGALSNETSVTSPTPLFTEVLVPAIPSGYTYRSLNIYTLTTNYDGVSPEVMYASAKYDISHGVTNNRMYPNQGSSVGASYNTELPNIAKTSHMAYVSVGGDATVQSLVGFLARNTVSYYKYLYSRFPQVTIGSDLTVYSGTLTNGQVSAWQTLSGLSSGQINSIRHDVADCTLVDVEIEYTVSQSPNVTTQDATEVSYTSATINGIVSDEGYNTAHAYFEYGSDVNLGSTIDIGNVTEGVAFNYDFTGLGYDETIYYRVKAINSDGTTYGIIKSFTTLYPTLSAPEKETPATGIKITERLPYFVFTLPQNTNNSATKYHARIRLGEYANMQGAAVYESKDSQTGWELWNGSTWEVFPAIGVNPNSKVRFRPAGNLGFLTYYWDCASYDGNNYGVNSSVWNFRVMLSTSGLYILVINSIEYNVYSLNIYETANGQIGKIEFELNNASGETNNAINYGDDVNVAVNDTFGNSEEYIGKVRSKEMQNYALKVVAITGSGILAERRCKVDYAAQDIGVTIKAIIDNYCDPLTTVNVNTTTGISASVVAIDKTPLAVLEDLRRQYGIMYYVDKDWDIHVYLPSQISSAYTTVRHGGA